MDGVRVSDLSSESGVGRIVVGGSGSLVSLEVKVGSRVESEWAVRYILSRTGSTIILRASFTSF